MPFSGGLGIILSLVFGCLLLALIAELYYLLRRKKPRINSTRVEEDYTTHAKDLFYLFCWNKPSSIPNQTGNEVSTSLTNPEANSHDPDIELLGSSRNMLLKAYGEDGAGEELTRLQNLIGPPRFLFTIKEETKEDLESDDGKSRGDRSREGPRTRSLNDLFLAAETPFLSPLSSPPLKVSASVSSDQCSCHGLNPFFRSSAEVELNRLRASPPPKFKFLRDAEEKLCRRLLDQAEIFEVTKNRGLQISKAKVSLGSPMAALEEAEKHQGY